MTIRAIALLVLACNCLLSVNAQDTAVAEKFALPPNDVGLPGAGPIRRYDWFQNSGEVAARRLPRRPRKARCGRLSRRLDHARLAGRFRGDFGDMKVANRGISGDTTRGMLLRLKKMFWIWSPLPS